MSSNRFLAAITVLCIAASARADILIGSYGSSTSSESLRAFADTANGNATPERVLSGPATGFTSPVGGVFEAAEGVIYVADFWGQAIRVYPAYATGNVAPLRVLASPFLGQVRTLAVDAAHDELLTIGSGCCLVAFARTASGTTAPLRSLSWGGSTGSVTQLNYPSALTFIGATDEVVLADSDAAAPYAPKLLVFNRTDSGNTAPKRVVRGALTGFGSWIAGVIHDPASQRLFAVAYVDNPDATRSGRVLVFDDQADGNVAPLRTISGAATGLELSGNASPAGLAIDPVRRRLIVSIGDYMLSSGNRLLVFDLEADGNTAPLQVIEGPQTTLDGQIATPIWLPTDLILRNGFD